jgi:hypothetical protein
MQQTKCLEVQAQGQPSNGEGGFVTHKHVSSQHERHYLLRQQPMARHILTPNGNHTCAGAPAAEAATKLYQLSTNCSSWTGVVCCVVLCMRAPFMQSVLLVAVMQQGGGSTQFIQLPAATHPPDALLTARWLAQPLLHLAAVHRVCLNAAIANRWFKCPAASQLQDG